MHVVDLSVRIVELQAAASASGPFNAPTVSLNNNIINNNNNQANRTSAAAFNRAIQP
jgi:hypothetical protein